MKPYYFICRVKPKTYLCTIIKSGTSGLVLLTIRIQVNNKCDWLPNDTLGDRYPLINNFYSISSSKKELGLLGFMISTRRWTVYTLTTHRSVFVTEVAFRWCRICLRLATWAITTMILKYGIEPK